MRGRILQKPSQPAETHRRVLPAVVYGRPVVLMSAVKRVFAPITTILSNVKPHFPVEMHKTCRFFFRKVVKPPKCVIPEHGFQVEKG